MDAVTKWVQWVPKAGMQKPDIYQFRGKGADSWMNGREQGLVVDLWEASNVFYRVPAPLDIDLPYLLKKSAACSPSTQSQVLALKAKFADDVCKLIDADTKGGAA